MMIARPDDARERDDALDGAKAIAIFAVVLFHVTRGFAAAGLIADSLWLRIADATAYGFHVQTFFLISGYLAFARAAEPAFQGRRLGFLYYSYLLWSLVYGVIGHALQQWVNTPPTLEDLAYIPIRPIGHFWFLLVLIGGTALLGLLRTPLRLAGGILLVIGVFGLGPSMYFNLAYMLIGGLLRVLHWRPHAKLPLALLGGGILLAFSAFCELRHLDVPGVGRMLPTLAGIYACYALGHLMTRSARVSAALSYCGRHTMSIYLLHVLAAAGLRIVLFHAAPGFNPWLGIVLCTLIAFAGPLLAEALARQARISALLGFQPWAGRGQPARRAGEV